jgi:hypothetical protein
MIFFFLLVIFFFLAWAGPAANTTHFGTWQLGEGWSGSARVLATSWPHHLID